MGTNRSHRIVGIALLLLASGFLLLRLVNPAADHPKQLTWSAAPYTDEGWYYSAAVRHINGSSWRQEGDFNPAITMPVAPLVQTGTFLVYGRSLATARTCSVICSLLALATAVWIAHRLGGSTTALITFLLISLNGFAFHFSRIALLENPMVLLVTLSVGVIVAPKNWPTAPLIVGASGFLILAILTKSSAIFAVPLVVGLAAWKMDGWKKRFLVGGITGLAILAAVFVYQTIVGRYFPIDTAYFREANLSTKLVLNPIQIIKNAIWAFTQGWRLEWVAFFAGTILCTVQLIRSKEFRRNKLVWIGLGWIALYLSLMGVLSYHPPRYFIPLVIPMAWLFATALSGLSDRFVLPAWIGIGVYLLVLHGIPIARHMANPEYTFQTMAREVSLAAIDADREPVLFGDLSSSVSLETGIFAVNATLGAETPAWRVKKYQPTHFITVNHQLDVVNLLKASYRLKEVGRWDVFGNYQNQQPVILYKLEPK